MRSVSETNSLALDRVVAGVMEGPAQRSPGVAGWKLAYLYDEKSFGNNLPAGAATAIPAPTRRASGTPVIAARIDVLRVTDVEMDQG